MTPQEMAEQIREVHKICQDWEDQPIGDNYKRPQWMRWFRPLYAMIGCGVLIGAVAILSQIRVVSSFQLHLEIGLMWSVVGIWIAYCVIASVIEVICMGKELGELSRPLSQEDAKDLEASICFDRRLAKLNAKIMEITAGWLEMRAKKIENARLFLMGLATLGSGVFGFLLWPLSPLRSLLAQKIPDNWVVFLQFWMFCALVGGVLAIGAGWSRGIRCANRALTLRRILANHLEYVNLEDPNPEKRKP